VGAASSRDHLISRLEAAPTQSLSYPNLDFPDKHILVITADSCAYKLPTFLIPEQASLDDIRLFLY
jgi:hypothetical protein